MQALPSLQGVPFAAGGLEQAPVAELQIPAAWEASAAAQVRPPLEACLQLSLMGGLFLRLTDRGEGLAEGDEERRFRGVKKSPWTAEVDGMNIHAGVTMRAGDREGLERLLRYCARPAFSLERLSQLADGRLAYELRAGLARTARRIWC